MLEKKFIYSQSITSSNNKYL